MARKDKKPMEEKKIEKAEVSLEIEQLEERIAPSSANFPPGQFPSGNPAHTPGNSNPNEGPGS
jgi:hypothetical protein